jgi:hypothetical protein
MAALRSSSRIRNKMTAKSAKSSNIAAPAPALHWTELVDTSSDGNENEQESDEQSASAYEMVSQLRDMHASFFYTDLNHQDMVPHATAPRQFFDTVELVENMLLFLLSNNTAALIKTSGLSPLFQPVINGSITLQRGLFLTPHERNLLDKTFHETGSDEVTDIFGEEIPMGALDIPTDPKFLRANPMLFRLQLDATDWTQELGMNVDMYDYLDIYNKIELKGTTFGNMLLTQPPVKEIKVLFRGVANAKDSIMSLEEARACGR